MYQENIIKAYNAESAVGGQSFIDANVNIYAPANDSFVAAEKIKRHLNREDEKKTVTNVYLCPISTKAHALGMALYFLWECSSRPTSIIFPFCDKHFNNTSSGIGKIMKFTILLP